MLDIIEGLNDANISQLNFINVASMDSFRWNGQIENIATLQFAIAMLQNRIKVAIFAFIAVIESTQRSMHHA